MSVNNITQSKTHKGTYYCNYGKDYYLVNLKPKAAFKSVVTNRGSRFVRVEADWVTTKLIEAITESIEAGNTIAV